MSSASLIRLGGLALCLGGLAATLFLLLAAPEGGFMGAHLPHQATWMPAHSLHALAGLLLLFGLVAVYAWRARAASRLGLAGFLTAFVGTALYLVTGVLTAFVMPVLATAAPSALEPGGAYFASVPLLLIFLGGSLLLLAGYAMLALDALRAGRLPRLASWAVLVGAVLGNLPAMPWPGLIAADLLWASGLAWWGAALWATIGTVTRAAPAPIASTPAWPATPAAAARAELTPTAGS
jgi:hypothetical protein